MNGLLLLSSDLVALADQPDSSTSSRVVAGSNVIFTFCLKLIACLTLRIEWSSSNLARLNTVPAADVNIRFLFSSLDAVSIKLFCIFSSFNYY